MKSKNRRPVSILFVCTGNICRSPLAEALLREYAASRGIGDRLRVGSAGTHAWEGNAATREAMRAGQEWGLDLSNHRAREVRRSIMDGSDIVLAMTRRHLECLAREVPERENTIYLALLYPRRMDENPVAAIDVPDPIGESVGFYIDVLKMLEPVLPAIVRGALGED